MFLKTDKSSSTKVLELNYKLIKIVIFIKQKKKIFFNIRIEE